MSTLPDGFSETLVASGIAAPTAMEIARDGRIFVAEQQGQVRVIKQGTLLAAPALQLKVDSVDERGLLGITLDPNFSINQYVYTYYTTASTPLHSRVSRFVVNGDVILPESETVLLELDNLTNTNHIGGAIHFGPDGTLFVGVGENGQPASSQSIDNLLGKVLRINSDGTIPSDNPFFNSASGRNRAIWSMGLRNPFTFAIQPGSGRVFINDVGQNISEEINDGVAGENYGWPNAEGVANNPLYRDPLYDYGHGGGDELGCAIAGGTFYNPITTQFPTEYIGDYFFADLCNSWIRRYDATTDSATGFAAGLPPAPVDLRVDQSGSLYYLSRGASASSGSVYKIQYTAGVPVRPWQNPGTHEDVDSQSGVAAIDALLIINHINMHGAGALPIPSPGFGGPPPFLDVSGDDFVSAIDVLLVINFINTQGVAEAPVWQLVAMDWNDTPSRSRRWNSLYSNLDPMRALVEGNLVRRWYP